ncbi:glutamate formiminotransferase/formiminotetrahydrofolate cyclodeaminase [Marinilabilia salmonicolor]|uniref:glutamate formimidoyltransferase n=1 Tax=Marinilabilia salmonicolor TaxID=989 RepID=UPI000D059D46|nr:glutamate formimidoyltransferase [Marinilabilia salmonicolor]PRZ00629.1 glutamate formiminotransferase/formiminotetrahydrofolate cyclodeaminase [Marinilabilia salmonicolor]
MQQLLECVPNFSEGRDMAIIKQITDEIQAVKGIQLVDVDPGKATNRTVVTFVGEPKPVTEAAFRAIKKASQLIDMRHHKGAHPRFGATDVCPLVPVSGISMEETAKLANELARRVGEELEIPVYCYEAAANEKKRKNLANCREGEYEALEKRLTTAEWKPDYGPATWNHNTAKTGATAIGARNFLIAYNVNLNTTSVRRANSVAFDIRERGRVKREGDPITGKIVTDEKGNKVWEPGLLKSVKGIGWFIEEYGIAQISMNLTDITVTPLHKAFDATCEQAAARGLRVTGSELVGVVPLEAMLEAGRYFLKKQRRSTGLPEEELIRIAVKSMGLDELYPFEPDKKIIEYILKDKSNKKLTDRTLKSFADETASESPAPGGGSIAAYTGALGAALGTMVANLSAHKRGWDHRWEAFSTAAEKGMKIQQKLLLLVDEDTQAFNKIMDAFSLPKSNEEEKSARTEAIQKATEYATRVPLKVMKTAFESFSLLKDMAENGNPNSVSDAGVGALCARAAVRGAMLNVLINAGGLSDKTLAGELINKGKAIEEQALLEEKIIMKIVNDKIK